MQQSKDVVFPAADSMVCTTFDIVDNLRVEEKDERFEVSISVTDPRVTPPQQNPIVTIRDDDGKSGTPSVLQLLLYYSVLYFSC